MARRNARRYFTVGCCLLGAAIAPLHAAGDQGSTGAGGAADSVQARQFRPIATGSPRQTLETFLYLADELDQIAATVGIEGASDDRESYERTLLLVEQATALIDLSTLPEAARREIGTTTVTYMLDIFGRVDLPEPESIPGAGDDQLPLVWHIPDTPLRIVKISEGPSQGEYLFGADAHQDAPRFYEVIRDLPLRSAAGIHSWTQALPQVTGPAIPAGVVRAIPEPLKRLWFGTPIWKILTVLASLIVLSLLVITLRRVVTPKSEVTTAAMMIRSSVVPATIILIAWWIAPFYSYELNISGAFWAVIANLLLAVKYAAAAWLFWVLALGVFDRIVAVRAIQREAYDPQLLQLGGRIVSILGVVGILAAGVQALGLPLYSIVAGFGIGGLALALAVRPSLENLIGGLNLYLDHPVRVGDFCSFGSRRGTVEKIGLRTVKLRGPDRTIITVPNASFADMELVNWTQCDKMLITTVIRLRYETDSDQLRHVLVRIREMFHAHPKIGSDTVRIRMTDFGPHSIDINVRVHALTREWNEFFAIREDVFLRIKDIVSASGASFALPSQTVHMTRDRGTDPARAEAAAGEVEEWRRSGRLPFPVHSERRLAELEGTLDWPPRGSFDSGTTGLQGEELLSADPPEEGGEDSSAPRRSGD